MLTTLGTNFILTLPSLSVDCEREFSPIKKVKTDWRLSLKSDTLSLSLKSDTLSDLMLVQLHSVDLVLDHSDPLPSTTGLQMELENKVEGQTMKGTMNLELVPQSKRALATAVTVALKEVTFLCEEDLTVP